MALRNVKQQAELPYDVVQAARQRIVNVFRNGLPVYLTVSGGKDSAVLAHLTLQLLREGKIDPARLCVQFIDEEAIFDSVEKTVKRMRTDFLAEGASFDWYCIEVKHYSCFNNLTSEESFYCWDSTCPDRWVRPMPKFAITDHPMLRRRQDTYQQFLHRRNLDGISVVGVRTSESHRRKRAMSARLTDTGQLMKPIYDWSNADVWRYLRDHNVPFPDTYLDLYRIGLKRNEMRLSQFFSIDTARVLVRLAEYEPDLMEKVRRREPNAYLASLYWDTELFRSSGGSGQVTDDSRTGTGTDDAAQEAADATDGTWKSRCLALLAHPPEGTPPAVLRIARRVVFNHALYLNEAAWRRLHGAIMAGDPKTRTIEAVVQFAIADKTKDLTTGKTWTRS